MMKVNGPCNIIAYVHTLSEVDCTFQQNGTPCTICGQLLTFCELKYQISQNQKTGIPMALFKAGRPLHLGSFIAVFLLPEDLGHGTFGILLETISKSQSASRTVL